MQTINQAISESNKQHGTTCLEAPITPACPPEPPKWRSEAGPIQSKKVQTVLNAIRQQHQTFTELSGVIGGEEHRFGYFSPFGGGHRDDVRCAWEIIGQQFGWLITRDNWKEVERVASEHLKSLAANVPVKDTRRTVEQEMERTAANEKRRAEQDAITSAKAQAANKITEQARAAYPWAQQEGSDHARGAANVKRLLCESFPGVAFRVKSDRFSGGSSIDVDWTDGPCVPEVSKLSQQFQYGHFDGMTDSYDHDSDAGREGFRTWMGSAKYVSANRRVSKEIERQIARAVCERVGATFPEAWPESPSFFALPNGHRELGQEVNCITHRSTIPAGGRLSGLELEHGDAGEWVCKWEVQPVTTVTTPATEARTGESGITVRRNHEKNGVEIQFPGKPAPSVLARLKEAGFHWGFHSKVWYKKYGAYAWAQAHTIAGLPLPGEYDPGQTDDMQTEAQAYNEQAATAREAFPGEAKAILNA